MIIYFKENLDEETQKEIKRMIKGKLTSYSDIIIDFDNTIIKSRNNNLLPTLFKLSNVLINKITKYDKN